MTIETTFSQFPELDTPRLHLRQITREDTADVFAFKSNPEVTLHYGQEAHRSADQTAEWIGRLISGYIERESLFWAITAKEEDRVIGGVTFWNFDQEIRCVELGYELHPAAWGKGLAAEACRAAINFGFTQMLVNRIEACPLAANIASSQLLQKLGFTLEGTLRQRVYFRGASIDQLYYGMLREDWLDLHAGSAG